MRKELLWRNPVVEMPAIMVLYIGRSILEPVIYTRETIMEKGWREGLKTIAWFDIPPLALGAASGLLNNSVLNGTLAGLCVYTVEGITQLMERSRKCKNSFATMD